MPFQKEENYFDIKEVAAFLSISQATVRNWIKSGRILPTQKVGSTLFFNQNDIARIKENITSGKSHRLKSRRNKRAVGGHSIPSNYVSHAAYLSIAKNLLNWVAEERELVNTGLILHEVALNLLVARKHCQPMQCLIGKSLTEYAQDNLLPLGCYPPQLNNLFDLTKPIQDHERNLLRKIRGLNIPFHEGDDLLGLLYMSLSPLGARKSKGAYFTPPKIVKTLVDDSLHALEIVTLPKILDPSCGTGNFLIRLFLVMRKQLLEQGADLKSIEKNLFTCLHGYDIDPMAIHLATINLILLLKTPLDEINDFQIHIQCKNTLMTHNHEEAFDLIIGNPPWGYSFSEREQRTFRKNFFTARGAMESFCLFIEYGINNLNQQGVLAFVLPESFLNVQIHEEARRLLVDHTEIDHIHLLGHRFSKVFAPSILLTTKKSIEPPLDSQITVHHNGKTHSIFQNRFKNNYGTIFNVKATRAEHEIIEHMVSLEEIQFLNGHADFALGIVTGNNEHFLLKKQLPGAEPVLKGGNIYKYNFYTESQYIAFEPALFQQVAPVKWYRAKEKLVYRFINENLVFAYDNQGLLSLNSANIVIPRLPNVAIKYILAVLNSRPAQFFHQVTFSSVKVLKSHIESIPIPHATHEEEKRIIMLVDQLLQTHDKLTRRQLYDQIDKIIMSLYQFNAKEHDIIYKNTEGVKFLSKP